MVTQIFIKKIKKLLKIKFLFYFPNKKNTNYCSQSKWGKKHYNSIKDLVF